MGNFNDNFIIKPFYNKKKQNLLFTIKQELFEYSLYFIFCAKRGGSGEIER